MIFYCEELDELIFCLGLFWNGEEPIWQYCSDDPSNVAALTMLDHDWVFVGWL